MLRNHVKESENTKDVKIIKMMECLEVKIQ